VRIYHRYAVDLVDSGWDRPQVIRYVAGILNPHVKVDPNADTTKYTHHPLLVELFAILDTPE
jgi:hypothetical protein